MKEITIPKEVNYIGVFLTFRCCFQCSYCINHFNDSKLALDEIDYSTWCEGLERIPTREDLPITLQGGEPTLYPHFYDLVIYLHSVGKKLDVLTNGWFSVAEFTKHIKPWVFKRESPYASIRFSYHPEVHNACALATKVFTMKEMGYSVGIWGLNRPDFKEKNEEMGEVCRTYGVDFRLKDFLGTYIGTWYGKMKYKGACDGEEKKTVSCKGSELLIGPQGKIYRCHRDLYKGENEKGNLLATKWILGKMELCRSFGECNPCDIKVKFNRFQEEGHCAVRIKKI